MKAQADLHVHSKRSDRPGAWVLRQLGSPESFTEPLEVYRRCRSRGMDFVTVTDHNTVAGALEIAHLPGTFLSSEVTTAFPEDGCQVHCLVWGVSEAQFAEIDRLRGNLYELCGYLSEQEVACALAHPLFRVDERLTTEHWEKLLVLFKRFEAINGTRDPQAGVLAQAILENLTPEVMAELAERHALESPDPEPWVKYLTAGSDDHGGLYVASAWTETPAAVTVEEFLDHLRRGEHRPAGEAGGSLRLARSFYHLARHYLDRRRAQQGDAGRDLVSELLDRILAGDGAAPSWAVRLRTGAARALVAGRALVGRQASPLAEEVLRRATARLPADGQPPERRCFATAAGTAQAAAAKALSQAAAALAAGRLGAALKSVGSLAPDLLAVAPILAAFHTQHKDDAFLDEVARRFEVSRRLGLRPTRKAWFTDTLVEVNGVARTVREAAACARRAGLDLTLLTCAEVSPDDGLPLANFPPLAAFPLPEYESLRLTVPPILDVVEHCERAGYTELLISTPGPLGLAALAASRLLNLPAVGIYHTDFPAYVRRLTADVRCEGLAWTYMRWFYGCCDRLYVPSVAYARQLAVAGFAEADIRLLPRGVDRTLFHPDRRRPGLWEEWGLGGGCRFLYVGRVSKEKNLELLLESFRALVDRGHGADLVVVGDGPELADLRARFEHPRLLFAGVLHGERLAEAYASSEVFVFPSTTDTYGNVVLEAHASGLPAIVADRGGPPEIVRAQGSGLVFDPGRPQELVDAMETLLLDSEQRQELGCRALAFARTASWDDLVAELWNGGEEREEEAAGGGGAGGREAAVVS